MALGGVHLGAAHSRHLMARPAVSARAAQLVAPGGPPRSIERGLLRLGAERGECPLWKLTSVPVGYAGFSRRSGAVAGEGISRRGFRLLGRARGAVGSSLLSPLSGALPGNAEVRA